MRDDPLKNLAVVQAVKDYPRLYERESGVPKEELEKLWNAVGAKVDLSGIVARDRWRIIRGSYVRYLKTKDSSSGPKKEYYLAKYLEFLRPFIKIREANAPSSTTTTCTISGRTKRKRTVTENSSEDSDAGEDSKEGTRDNTREIIFEDLDSTESQDSLYTITLRNGELVEPARNLNATSASSAAREVTPRPLVVQHQSPVAAAPSFVVQHEDERNPDLMFFKSLLPQMANWTKKQRTRFKVAILNAMDEIDE